MRKLAMFGDDSTGIDAYGGAVSGASARIGAVMPDGSIGICAVVGGRAGADPVQSCEVARGALCGASDGSACIARAEP